MSSELDYDIEKLLFLWYIIYQLMIGFDYELWFVRRLDWVMKEQFTCHDYDHACVWKAWEKIFLACTSENMMLAWLMCMKSYESSVDVVDKGHTITMLCQEDGHNGQRLVVTDYV